MRIKHNPQGRDRLILDLQLGSMVHNRDKPILLVIVPGLSRIQYGTGSNVQSASSSIPDYYRYELKENEGHAFHEEFEGNIFGKSVQELNLDFNLNVGTTNFAVEKIPQRIYIDGIGDTNVVAVYPQPTLRYPLVLGYEYTPGSGKESMDLEARERWFAQAIVTSPAMFRRTIGAGSLYWLGNRDASGAFLDGGKSTS